MLHGIIKHFTLIHVLILFDIFFITFLETYTFAVDGGSQRHSPVLIFANINSPVRGSGISTHSTLKTQQHFLATMNDKLVII